LFDGDNLSAPVGEAVWAHAMRPAHLATLRAGHQDKWAQFVMRPAAVAARLGQLFLGNGTHGLYILFRLILTTI
jgi:hypothetical protein